MAGCALCRGAFCAERAGHARARSRSRRSRRGRALRISKRDTCVPAHVPAVVSGGAQGPAWGRAPRAAGPSPGPAAAGQGNSSSLPLGPPLPSRSPPHFPSLERGGSARVRSPRRPFVGVPPIYSARVWPSVPTPVSAGRAPRRPCAPRCLFSPLRPQGDHFSTLSLWSRARSVRFALQPAKPTS